MNNAASQTSPHLHGGRTVAAVMREVCLALIPGILVAVWLFGPGVLIQCVLACTTTLAAEALMLKLLHRPIRPFITDGSAVVTGLLLALTLSPFAPWWMTMLAAAFAIVVAKHLFGGIGYNLFNPAMAGYVLVLLCFPATLTVWPDITESRPALGQTLAMIFTGAPAGGAALDAVSGATPLEYLRGELRQMVMISELRDGPYFGLIGAHGWEWLAMAYLLGGIWLLFRGIIKWRIPAGVIAGLLISSLLFYSIDTDHYASPMFHLFSGGLMLGAFFIATDPVSAATTPRGRLIFGAGIGILTCVIRTFGGYPDGLAFAVLIMNSAVPLIDRFTRPPALGEAR